MNILYYAYMNIMQYHIKLVLNEKIVRCYKEKLYFKATTPKSRYLSLTFFFHCERILALLFNFIVLHF